MAGNLTDFAESKLLSHITGKLEYPAPISTNLGLFTVAPNDAGGGGVEVSGNNYARRAIVWGDPITGSGTISNSTDIIFPSASGSWGTIVAIGIWDDTTNLLLSGPLTAPIPVGTGDVFRVSIGHLILTLG